MPGESLSYVLNNKYVSITQPLGIQSLFKADTDRNLARNQKPLALPLIPYTGWPCPSPLTSGSIRQVIQPNNKPVPTHFRIRPPANLSSAEHPLPSSNSRTSRAIRTLDLNFLSHPQQFSGLALFCVFWQFFSIPKHGS